MLIITLEIALLMTLTCAYTQTQLIGLFHEGIRDIKQETINGNVTIEEGTIPYWLSGNFIRHSCGVLGETDHRNFSLPNFIDHLFDCWEIGSKFRMEKGHVTFTNRWYDTVTNDIYNYYGRNMNASSVFTASTFGKANPAQVDKWEKNLTMSSKVEEVPHVSWWQIGNEAIAMTEMPIGVVIDTDEVVQKGKIQYRDHNMGYTSDVTYANNPAHEHTEPDGTLWSAVSAIKFTSRTSVKIWRAVYKVGADKVRHVVGEYHYDDSDLTKCNDTHTYPSFGSRFGYLHSFCLTERYIILPETAYMYDPCVLTHYDKHKPFFPQGYKFEQNGFSRLLVMRKSDGHFIANITTPPFFATHQLGSYEDGNLIYMDMLTYNDSSVYEKHTNIQRMLNDDHFVTNVTRITINMTDMTATFRSLRKPGVTPAAFEMSNINYAYNAKKYTYGYMAKNFDQREQNALTKINVDTGVETEYLFPEGMFVQEPLFVSKPGAAFEDDGVVIAQGIDGRKAKAFMVVVDAKTMTLIGHVTAPDRAMFGLHNRLYPLNLGKEAVNIDHTISQIVPVG